MRLSSLFLFLVILTSFASAEEYYSPPALVAGDFDIDSSFYFVHVPSISEQGSPIPWRNVSGMDVYRPTTHIGYVIDSLRFLPHHPYVSAFRGMYLYHTDRSHERFRILVDDHVVADVKSSMLDEYINPEIVNYTGNYYVFMVNESVNLPFDEDNLASFNGSNMTLLLDDHEVYRVSMTYQEPRQLYFGMDTGRVTLRYFSPLLIFVIPLLIVGIITAAVVYIVRRRAHKSRPYQKP